MKLAQERKAKKRGIRGAIEGKYYHISHAIKFNQI